MVDAFIEYYHDPENCMEEGFCAIIGSSRDIAIVVARALLFEYWRNKHNREAIDHA